MVERISIAVAGTPRALPRPRFVKGRAVSIAGKPARAWKAAVEREARAVLPVPDWTAGPVAVDMVFYMPTKDRARHGRPHTAKPDADNLAKMILDCLERAGVLAKGDAAVARVGAEKVWAPKGGCVVEISIARIESRDGLGVAFVADDVG